MRFSLPADEFVAPMRRRAPRRSSSTWVLLLLLGAAGGAWFARDSLMAPRSATAVIPVEPPDAALSIDGQELAPQGGMFKVPDLAGDRDHLIEVSHKGFVAQTRRIRLAAGEVRVLPNIVLEALPAASARLPPRRPPRAPLKSHLPRPPLPAKATRPESVLRSRSTAATGSRTARLLNPMPPVSRRSGPQAASATTPMRRLRPVKTACCASTACRGQR